MTDGRNSATFSFFFFCSFWIGEKKTQQQQKTKKKLGTGPKSDACRRLGPLLRQPTPYTALNADVAFAVVVVAVVVVVVGGGGVGPPAMSCVDPNQPTAPNTHKGKQKAVNKPAGGIWKERKKKKRK